MSLLQINHSPDLKRLRDEGYEVEARDGYLIIHHVPYVNSQKFVKYGKLISTLTLQGDKTTKPDNHVMGFMGEYPCNNDGSIITAIKHGNPNKQILDGVVMNFTFSNKPSEGYDDYFHKVTRYLEIIIAQAQAIDPEVTAKTFNVTVDSDEGSCFKYIDSNSSRANILQLNLKFKGQKIGIIGLGGTGSYILDQVAKTHVDEIHLFDGKDFFQHCAFRSPGAASIESLRMKHKKVDYYSGIYSNMRSGIISYPEYITEDNLSLLKELTFIFICVDNNIARAMIIDKLLEFGIPFIDVGMGVNLAEDNLVGQVRTTFANNLKCDHLQQRIGSAEIEENEYSTNIQIADLNALNALFAVIKWKKISGFYVDSKLEYNSTYVINTNQLLNEDYPED